MNREAGGQTRTQHKISKIISTHKIYSYDGNKKTESYPKSAEKGGKVIELLTNTQTHVIGDRLITHDIPPKRLTDSEFQQLRLNVKKIYALTDLSKHYPAADSKQRDEFVMRVAGTLVRETNWPTHEKEDFIEELCKANNDDELRNRVNKVRYQEEQLKLNQEVYGVKALCQFIKVKELDCIDAIKPEGEKAKGVSALTLSEMVSKNYPQPQYIIYPLLTTEMIIQIWGPPGVGKSLIALELAASIVNGHDFLKWKATRKNKEDEAGEPWPVFIVDGENRASTLVERSTSITQRYYDKGKKFNQNLLYFAPLVEQPQQTFQMLNTDIGRQNVELKAEQIAKKHNKKPFIFIDNISCLTAIQEKDAQEWQSFMSWLIKLRARGYGVIFIHHATKEGSTSSGSNFKERAVDVEIKLEVPEPKERIEGYTGAQCKVSFPKWREWGNSGYSVPFIATLDRNSFEWRTHAVKGKTKRNIEKSFKGGGGVKEAMQKTGLSQAQVYRAKAELRKENPEAKEFYNKKTGRKKKKIYGGSLSEQKLMREYDKLKEKEDMPF